MSESWDMAVGLLTLLGTTLLIFGVARGSLSADVLVRLYKFGRDMHPNRSASDLLKRTLILSIGATRAGDLRVWWQGIAHNPKAATALQHFPKMQRAIYRTYINRHWAMRHRLKVIDGHYRLIEDSRAIVAEATKGAVEIASLEARHPGLKLALTKMDWFHREGEVVLILFLQDREMMSIAFTLGQQEQEVVAYVGGIQGYKSADSLQTYRDLTHALHGMRPRDLTITTLKILLREIGVSRICAVANDARHNFEYLARRKVPSLDYDEIWLEHGGRRLENGFYDIPLEVKHKAPSEIPTRKRALYRRRYQMLETIELEIQQNCSRYARAASLAQVRQPH